MEPLNEFRKNRSSNLKRSNTNAGEDLESKKSRISTPPIIFIDDNKDNSLTSELSINDDIIILDDNNDLDRDESKRGQRFNTLF